MYCVSVMLYICNYLALYNENNVNNMIYVGSYCLFLARLIKFSLEHSSHIIPLLVCWLVNICTVVWSISMIKYNLQYVVL